VRIAVGSDERTPLTDAVVALLRSKGHELELFGPLGSAFLPWPEVAVQVAGRVAAAACEQGVLFCWTGTGVSIAANKVPGIRAALCADAETARGARRWNDANILCLSLRLISPVVAQEIIEAWLAISGPEPDEAANIAKVADLDRARRMAG